MHQPKKRIIKSFSLTQIDLAIIQQVAVEKGISLSDALRLILREWWSQRGKLKEKR